MCKSPAAGYPSCSRRSPAPRFIFARCDARISADCKEQLIELVIKRRAPGGPTDIDMGIDPLPRESLAFAAGILPDSMPLRIDVPADNSIDLFVNRRGPILRRYLDEAIWVARRGAVIVGLHPTGNAPAPAWRDHLPEPYRKAFKALPFDQVTDWVIAPLRTAGISDYSLWWIDVPEFLRTPYELYARLGGSRTADAPEYQTTEPQLAKIVKEYGTSKGIVLRHQRLLWQVYLP